jgi:hypothetical protein
MIIMMMMMMINTVTLLCKSETSTAILMDFLIDIIFSSESNNILREEVSPLVPPANSLIPPQPNFLTFQFPELMNHRLSGTMFVASSTTFVSSSSNNNSLTTTTTTIEDETYDSLFEKNKKRRLVSRNNLQTKFFAPPKNDTPPHDQLEHRYSSIAANQRHFFDLFSFCLQKSQVNYAHLASALISRMSSFYPVPAIEQYDDVLPKRSNFEVDIYTRKLVDQNPILIKLLHLISTG